MTRRTPTTTVALALLAFTAACGSEAPANDGTAETPSTSNVSLATVNESGVQGLVTVSGGDEVMFKLELMGLTSGESYSAALHAGTCDSPGDRVADLNPATSGGIGIGSSVTQVPRDAVADAGALHIQAHLPDGTLAACGDLPDRLLTGI